MYDRSLQLSTMLFRAPSFGTLDLATAEALLRRCDTEGLDATDQMTFANNTIEDMAAVAEGALTGRWINEADA